MQPAVHLHTLELPVGHCSLQPEACTRGALLEEPQQHPAMQDSRSLSGPSTRWSLDRGSPLAPSESSDSELEVKSQMEHSESELQARSPSLLAGWSESERTQVFLAKSQLEPSKLRLPKSLPGHPQVVRVRGDAGATESWDSDLSLSKSRLEPLRSEQQQGHPMAPQEVHQAGQLQSSWLATWGGRGHCHEACLWLAG